MEVSKEPRGDSQDSLELELQADVNHQIRVLGAELRSSGRQPRLLTAEPSLQPIISAKSEWKGLYNKCF